MKRFAPAALLLAGLLAPVFSLADNRATDLAIGDPARRDRKVAVVLDGITDGARGDTIGPAELAARLDGVKLLFVGEGHVDAEFHRVQLEVLRQLEKRGRHVMVGLEMYPVPEQKWLDRWHSDRKLTEEGFLRESRWYRNWGYNWHYYRDIFLFAREKGIRMFAVNLPRAAVTAARMKGFDSLSVEHRAMLPPKVDLENAEHRKLFRAFFDDEDALHGNMPDDLFEMMFRAQCAWDAAMGWNALQALKQHGGEKSIMVVLVGSGHVAYGLGAERQVKPWFDGRTASVLPMPVAEEPGGEPITHLQASYADFVWGLPVSADPIYPSLGLATPETRSAAGRFKVINVAKGSPADAAGVKTGDELVSVDGLAIAEKEVMHRHMASKRWGDDVALRLVREGQELALTVHLRRRPPEPAASDSAGTAAKPKEAAPAHPAMPAMPPKPAGGGGR